MAHCAGLALETDYLTHRLQFALPPAHPPSGLDNGGWGGTIGMSSRHESSSRLRHHRDYLWRPDLRLCHPGASNMYCLYYLTPGQWSGTGDGPMWSGWRDPNIDSLRWLRVARQSLLIKLSKQLEAGLHWPSWRDLAWGMVACRGDRWMLQA